MKYAPHTLAILTTIKLYLYLRELYWRGKQSRNGAIVRGQTVGALFLTPGLQYYGFKINPFKSWQPFIVCLRDIAAKTGIHLS